MSNKQYIAENDNIQANVPRVDLQQRQPLQQTHVLPTSTGEIYNADQLEMYRRMQNFTNANWWNLGSITNQDPHTLQGQEAIQANFNYAKRNVQNLGEALITTGIGEGVGQTLRYLRTPERIGSGAEAVVSKAPGSRMVRKSTSIPRSEMHARNRVPGAIKSNYLGTTDGMAQYSQPAVRIVSAEEFERAIPQLDSVMTKKGWHRYYHPNLQGPAYTNGRLVVSDIKPGNVGKSWFGRPGLADFVVETIAQNKAALQKRGGKLINKN